MNQPDEGPPMPAQVPTAPAFSSTDPWRRRLVRSGLGILIGTFVVAVVGAALLGTRNTSLEPIGQVVHRIGQYGMLFGLVIILCGYRIQQLRALAAPPSVGPAPLFPRQRTRRPFETPFEQSSPIAATQPESPTLEPIPGVPQNMERSMTNIADRRARTERIPPVAPAWTPVPPLRPITVLGASLVGGAVLLGVLPPGATLLVLSLNQMFLAVTFGILLFWDRGFWRTFSIGGLVGVLPWLTATSHVSVWLGMGAARPNWVNVTYMYLAGWLGTVLLGLVAVILRAFLAPSVAPRDLDQQFRSQRADEDR